MNCTVVLLDHMFLPYEMRGHHCHLSVAQFCMLSEKMWFLWVNFQENTSKGGDLLGIIF